MNAIRSAFRSLVVPTILLALGALGAAQISQPQIAAPAAIPAQNSACGNQALCYEANDFTATITDFRTSTQSYLKIIDVIVRFQNKTNRPLILGYVANSGTAMDDRGNRYGVWGANGFRGIGQVYGPNNFDPKFNLPPGGFGDAQFELAWNPGQQVYGLTFELSLTVDELSTVEGNQHTLAGEFPLHYRGLANGVAGSAVAPGQASAFSSQGRGPASSIAGVPPCNSTATNLAGAANSAGVQVPASANTAVTNATSAFSSLGSLFGKKKAAAAPTVQNAASTAPCAPVATSTGTPADNSMSATSGTAFQPTGTSMTATGTPAPATTPVNTTPGAATTKAATTTTGTAKAATTTTTASTTVHPVAVVKAPSPPATPAVKKPVPPPVPAKKPVATNQ
jgi:hypothetical protein